MRDPSVELIIPNQVPTPVALLEAAAICEYSSLNLTILIWV